MKKLIIAIISIISAFALVACINKTEKTEVIPIVDTPSKSEETSNVKETEEKESTDEEKVALALEKHYKLLFPEEVEQLNPIDIKIYTPEEIASDEVLSQYTYNSGDIMFDASYEIKLFDGVDDMMKYTSESGKMDGQWIRNKHNVGILKYRFGSYMLDEFRTEF